MKRWGAWMVVALLLGGCASVWVRVTEPSELVDPHSAVRVPMPAGWMRLLLSDRLTITRDGLGLQWIEVWQRDHGKAFPAVRKSSSADALPSELANLAVTDIAKGSGLGSGLEVEENAPATVAGRPGFHLLLAFRNDLGLRFRREVYGYADARGFVTFSYQAPVPYYFERDRALFQGMVAGARRAIG